MANSSSNSSLSQQLNQNNHHRFGPSSITNTSINHAGAADEELFMKSFEDVPRIQVNSATEMVNVLTEITTSLEDTSKDWEKRVECLRRIRSLISSGYASQYPTEFGQSLIAVPYEASLNDLRSKVVNEACVTIAYVSQTYGSKVDRFIEKLLNTIIKQIQNSAKFISTSAVVCIRFIIQFTHSQRLIPILCNHINDKSKAIRKAICEFLDQLLHTWPTAPLEKHQLILQATIKKGIADADADARVFARRAFWGYAEHFRDQADHVIHQLDSQKQKQLYGEIGGTLSASNSSNSLSHFLPGSINGGVSTSNSGPRSLNYQHVPSSGYGQANGTSSNNRMIRGQGNHRSTAGKSVSASNSIENLYRPWSNRSSNMPNVPGVARSIINNQIALRKQLSNGNGFNNNNNCSNSVSGSRMAYGRQSITGRSVSASNSIENLCRPWSSMSGTSANAGGGGHVPTFRSTRLSSLQLSGGKSRIPVYSPSPSKSSESSPNTVTTVNDATPPRPFQPLIVPSISSKLNPSSPSTPLRSCTSTTVTTSGVTSCPNSSKTDSQVLISNDLESQLQKLQLEIQQQQQQQQYQQQQQHQHQHQQTQQQQPPTDTIDHSLNVLSPVINELPSNAVAIKMLTKLVEEQPNSVVIQLLPKVMPALVEAYDSPDISIRKAAVFAMVSIHNSVGFDVLSPFLTNLNPSKMKLLKLYISRSTKSESNYNSTCNSVRNSTSSSPQ